MTETRELNYAGLVSPEPGQLMGPDLKNRHYVVLGSMYDTGADRTTVTLEELTPEKLDWLLKAAAA